MEINLKHTSYDVLCALLCSVASVMFDPLQPYSLPGSSLHGILQQRIMEQLPCPPAGDLPDPGIEPISPALQADSLMLRHQGGTCLMIPVRNNSYFV